MPRMRLVEYALAASALVAAAVGCGPRYYVARPAPVLYGRVSIEVSDRREPKRGGSDPSQIGVERSGWGIPYPIRVAGPAGLVLEMHDLLSEAANAASIGVLPLGQAAGATSRLAVEIQTFWCDGYFPVFKAHAVASAVIVDGLTNQVRVPGQPLVADGEAGDCRTALARMRRSLFATASAFFATPQLHDALIGEPATAPPAPPPPTSAAPPQQPAPAAPLSPYPSSSSP